MQPTRTTPDVRVEVESGKTATVTVAFPTGGITVVIRTGECQHAILMPRDEAAKDLVAASRCESHAEVELLSIPPGDYRISAGSKDCTPITVAPSPAKQTFTVK